MSELIHNSANRPSASFARVSVHFLDIIDIDDDQYFWNNGLISSYEVVPNSLVVVSRVAYQNNTSKYFINNKSSTASEVTTLLKQRGIDLDNNRFLILQGEVEQISLMKPKVRRIPAIEHIANKRERGRLAGVLGRHHRNRQIRSADRSKGSGGGQTQRFPRRSAEPRESVDAKGAEQ